MIYKKRIAGKHGVAVKLASWAGTGLAEPGKKGVETPTEAKTPLKKGSPALGQGKAEGYPGGLGWKGRRGWQPLGGLPAAKLSSGGIKQIKKKDTLPRQKKCQDWVGSKPRCGLRPVVHDVRVILRARGLRVKTSF